MKFLILVTLFSSSVFAAENCPIVGPTYTETMNLPQFRGKDTENKRLTDFSKVIRKMTEFRNNNSCATAKDTNTNCRGFCGLLYYRNYRDNCSEYCDEQATRIEKAKAATQTPAKKFRKKQKQKKEASSGGTK